MTYVDAGYAIALTVLALYAAGLVARRRRLERAARVAGAVPPEPPVPDTGALTGLTAPHALGDVRPEAVPDIGSGGGGGAGGPARPGGRA